jgi:hypothetical protein
MDGSYRSALNDDIQHFSNILKSVYLAAGKTQSEVPFDCNQEGHMTYAVPALDVIGRQAIAVFNILFIEDVAHDCG